MAQVTRRTIRSPWSTGIPEFVGAIKQILQRTTLRANWWYRWLRPAVVGIALVSLIYFSKGALANWLSAGVFLLLLLGAVSIFSVPLDRAVSRRRIRKIPTLNDDWILRLSDEGMSSSGKRGEGRLDWTAFSRARRFADGLLLFQWPHPFHWFPDSACTQPARRSEVGDLVRCHTSDYRDVGRHASSDRTQTALPLG